MNERFRIGVQLTEGQPHWWVCLGGLIPQKHEADIMNKEEADYELWIAEHFESRRIIERVEDGEPDTSIRSNPSMYPENYSDL